MAKDKKPDFTDGMSVSDDGDSMQVNLSDVDESGDFPVIPAGRYPAIVESLEHVISKAGNKMWTWRVKITEGEYEKRLFFYHTVWNDTGIGRIKKAIMALGVESLLSSTFDPTDPEIMDQLVGQECTIKIEKGTWEGKPNNNVKAILKLESSSEGGSDFL